MILAGDVGGTKTVIALYEKSGADVRQVREATFPSQQHSSLEEILATFLHDSPGTAVASACFGVAGAVIEGQSRTTNLPWQLDERALARAVGAPHAKLLNDLEAAAYGMLFLQPSELCVLNPAARPERKGNVAVIAAGTGLGEAFLFWDGQRHHPIASEGGHSDFAPRTDLEIDLLRYLRNQYGSHVSCERVLSGPGFLNVYTFLRDTGRYPESPALAEQLRTGEAHTVISQRGLAGDDPLCVATLELFVTVYGAETGNLALKCVALGGVFMGGGIAPKLLPALQRGSFMHGFLDKGRFAELLKGMEVSVALNPRAPLLGAAHYARQMTG